MIQSYFNEVSGRQIVTGLVLSYQTVGDFARFNSHYHAIILEGGFDREGNFVYLLISSTKQMTDYFKENFKVFGVPLFIAEVTAHISPKNKQYIRRYGLYASRT